MILHSKNNIDNARKKIIFLALSITTLKSKVPAIKD